MKPKLSFVNYVVISCLTGSLLLGGCGKKLTPDTEIKSVIFYIENTDEAKKVKSECDQYISNKYSTLSSTEREIVNKSNYVLNCNNAGNGIYGAYQKRLREAASKY